METRTIKTCAGAGDSCWIFQKLINSGEKFNFEIPDSQPQRSKPLFDLLPSLVNSAKYVPGLSYRKLAALNIQVENRYFKQIREQDFYLTCNEWLERGRKLVDFFPDLPISYTLPWEISDADQFSCMEDCLETEAPLVGIYCSAYSTTRAWQEFGAWTPKKWFELISLISEKRPDVCFVIVGASFDIDFATELIGMLEEAHIPYKSTIGKPLGYVMSLMQMFEYAFYFPSGLPIISETLADKTPCTMFYGTNLKAMMGTWCDPERRASGQFKECLFCDPREIFDWVTQNNYL